MSQQSAITGVVCIARSTENAVDAIKGQVVEQGVFSQLGTSWFDTENVFEGRRAGKRECVRAGADYIAVPSKEYVNRKVIAIIGL
jgi:hypothetical protein